MGKNYTPSVSMVNGALKINQTKPENRKKFMVGKIAGAELTRLREKSIETIAKSIESNIDEINKGKRERGFYDVVEITQLNSLDAIDVLRSMKVPADPQDRQDLSSYDEILFPYDNTKEELIIRDREYELFDIAWEKYIKKVKNDRVEAKQEQIRKDRMDAMFSGWKKEEGKPKRVPGEILDDDIYGRMDDSDNDNLSGDFFESGTRKK